MTDLVAVPRIGIDLRAIKAGALEASREFHRVDVELGRFHNEFYEIASTMSLDARHGYTTQYALDFDVIKGALDLHIENAFQQFWSSVVINLGDMNFNLFPGTLFELQKYLLDKIETVRRRSSRLFGNKLHDVFDLLRVSHIRNPYHSELESFRLLDLERRDQYILKAVQDQLTEKQTFPKIHAGVFESAVRYISRGSRVDLWENNRADAINYSILHSCNRHIRETGVRHILVSNTRAMQRLDQAMRATFSLGDVDTSDSAVDLFRSGVVWNARSTALHQLLLRAGGGAAGAETIAWKIVGNISDYRKRLAEIREHSLLHRSAANLPYLKDLLVGVVAEFDDIQRQLDTAASRNQIMLDGAIYQPDDPEEFYQTMERFIDNRLSESGYRKTLIQQDAAKLPLHLRKAERLGDRPSFQILDELNEVVATLIEGEEAVMITDCAVSVEEFLICVDTVQAMILSKLTLGDISFDALCHQDDNYYDDIVIVGISEQGIRSKRVTSNSSYSVASLAEMFECFPSDIRFVRIDGPLLSFSFEGDIIGISSRFKLPAEFETFISGVVRPRYKGRNFERPVRSYFRRSEFDFLTTAKQEEAT
ncbi:MAG TPA: hypothetical protein VF574_01380 [Allosphingosinicella sp.]|jgi:hypothetical protein